MDMEVLRTKNLVVGYKDKAILPPINVSLNEGNLIALIGPNGAGKSTLFKGMSCGIISIVCGGVVRKT